MLPPPDPSPTAPLADRIIHLIELIAAGADIADAGPRCGFDRFLCEVLRDEPVFQAKVFRRRAEIIEIRVGKAAAAVDAALARIVEATINGEGDKARMRDDRNFLAIIDRMEKRAIELRKMADAVEKTSREARAVAMTAMLEIVAKAEGMEELETRWAREGEDRPVRVAEATPVAATAPTVPTREEFLAALDAAIEGDKRRGRLGK